MKPFSLCLFRIATSIGKSLSSQEIEISKSLKSSLDTDLPSADSLFNLLFHQITNNEVSSELISPINSQLTKALFEDLNYYEQNFNDSTNSIKRKLLNFYPLKQGTHLSMIGYFDKKSVESNLVMLVNLIVHVDKGKITFSSPLAYNTKAWKQMKVGNVTYHYRDSLREDRAEKFAQKNRLFAARFKKQPKTLKFYMVNNYQEILRLLGIQFHAGSVGRLRDGYGVLADEYIFSVMNNEDFSHDLFHYYSGSVHNQSVRNWVTEEGIAYSWGNAYYTRIDGEMGEQDELVRLLVEYLNENQEADLLSLFENNFWTDTSGIYDHLAPDFKVGRLISSIICDEVMRIHGMDGINQLISCGSKPNRFDPFFETTDRLINLNRDNFQNKLKELIGARS